MKPIMLCVCMVLVSCATSSPQPPPSQLSSQSLAFNAPDQTEEVSGVFFSNFEEHCLMPDGVDEAWWVLPNDGLLNRYRSVAKIGDELYARVHVKMRGIKSKPGHYGRMNMYDREFRMTELLELRPLSEVSPWK